MGKFNPVSKSHRIGHRCYKRHWRSRRRCASNPIRDGSLTCLKVRVAAHLKEKWKEGRWFRIRVHYISSFFFFSFLNSHRPWFRPNARRWHSSAAKSWASSLGAVAEEADVRHRLHRPRQHHRRYWNRFAARTAGPTVPDASCSGPGAKAIQSASAIVDLVTVNLMELSHLYETIYNFNLVLFQEKRNAAGLSDVWLRERPVDSTKRTRPAPD